MTTIALALWICTIWGAIHFLHRLQLTRSREVLPSLSTSTSGQTRFSKWDVSLHGFHLKLETTSFNDAHNRFISFLQLPDGRGLRRALKFFYDVGSIVGVVGVFGGSLMMLWNIKQTGSSLFAGPIGRDSSLNGEGGDPLYKRGISSLGDSPSIPNNGLELNLLIPGITTPLSHLPVLLASLFISQVIHEAGHAISASIDALPLYSLGVSLTLIIPAAMTSLSPSLKSLPASARMRIISSGAWHNLLLYGLIHTLRFSSLSGVWGLFGWEDMSGLGKVVLNVDSDSPLSYHLLPGSLIRALDDTPVIQPSDFSFDPWTSYLHDRSDAYDLSEGWCVPSMWFTEHGDSCCSPGRGSGTNSHPPLAQQSCFVDIDVRGSLSHRGQGHCIDPVPVLVPNHSDVNNQSYRIYPRCSSSRSCNHNSGDSGEEMTCIQPDIDTQLLRIRFDAPPWREERSLNSKASTQKTILWSGPKVEVWEQVEIGTYRSRSQYLPLWFPDFVSLFGQYLSALTLSLFIFNLLCLPFLDGYQFCSALLDFLVDTLRGQNQETFSLDDLESNVRRPATRTPVYRSPSIRKSSSWLAQQKVHILQGYKYLTATLCLCLIIGNTMLQWKG